MLSINGIVGTSVLGEQSAFTSTIGNTSPIRRETTMGDIVDVYRNLHRPQMFSIRQRQGPNKSKVSGYAKAILIKKPTFVISEAGRQKVLAEKRKHVHAFVRGQFFDAFVDPVSFANPPDRRVSYNPYRGNHFFDCDTGEDITEDMMPQWVLLQGSGMFFLN